MQTGWQIGRLSWFLLIVEILFFISVSMLPNRVNKSGGSTLCCGWPWQVEVFGTVTQPVFYQLSAFVGDLFVIALILMVTVFTCEVMLPRIRHESSRTLDN